MWINVTAKDILDGSDAYDSCPVTLALQRRFGKNISISRDFLRIQKKKYKNIRNKWHLLPLPESVKQFVLTYEGYLAPSGVIVAEMYPFKFWLNDSFVKNVRKYI